MTFQIKVCGITRPLDAKRAAALGADMIGLIFYPGSPRYLTVNQAAGIIESLPATVDRVGVFVEPSLDIVLRLAGRLKLDFVQLHGRLPVKTVSTLRKSGLKVIQAFNVRSPLDYASVYRSKADLVLLDTPAPGLYGGSGQPFDWRIKPPKRIPNLMLAGGISVKNVKEGVSRFRPLVVDVNSQVEKSPGLKSNQKLTAFFARCDRMRYAS